MHHSAKNTVSRSNFFSLLDSVLVEAGRTPLPDDSPQRRIIHIDEDDRVLQILAGPGSGKTEMLAWRVLYDLFVRGTPANTLLVTTFTKRAATELQVRLVERCDQLLKHAHAKSIPAADPRVHDLQIGTLHSLCHRLLAEYDAAYMASGTELMTDLETKSRLIKDHRHSLGFSGGKGPPRVCDRLIASEPLLSLFRPHYLSPKQWPAQTIQKARFLQELLAQHTETWIPRCSTTGSLNGVEQTAGPNGLTHDLSQLQKRWEQYLDQQDVLDFPTIQKRFLERQASLAPHFTHVFVDEFQDNNPIQFAIHTGWLQSPSTLLTVVGDDDQAVYRFRGSDLSCFQDLEPHCRARNVPFRQEKLQTNYRSSATIVDFSEQYRNSAKLGALSLSKTIVAETSAPKGAPVRLLTGPWPELAAVVASEAVALADDNGHLCGSAAMLMFSTSELGSSDNPRPASMIRDAINNRGLRLYNPRSKVAGQPDSPFGMLFGILSYLIDPITKAPAGKDGRSVMVWASHDNSGHATHALSAPPPFPIANGHQDYQKKFRNNGGAGIGPTPPDRQAVLDYVDSIRNNLIAQGSKARLSLHSLVSRLLTLPFFRASGFTIDLFRQALFTQLLEDYTAPTRRTRSPLDGAIDLKLQHGKYLWPGQYWNFLGTFGAILKNTTLDDPEVEAFEDGSLPLLTFHQAKGLEWDSVYVAATGRDVDVGPVLRTEVFSGRVQPFTVIDGHAMTTTQATLDLAEADRDREVYVAITRAKRQLTILLDPASERDGKLHPAIHRLFSGLQGVRYPDFPKIIVKEYSNE
ncbi:MAG: ATP-dependent helicase [Phycisphaera sp.]|nr:MAG: ATP-dependent helicase [Phycisphaera sp.]